MEGLIGIAFNDFVLLAADRTMTFSILAVKHDADKLVKLDDRLVLAVSGEPGDSIQFAEYIEKNVQLYRMRNGFELTPSSAGNFIRRALADALRTRSAYQVNCLLAGFDSTTQKASLFYLDHLATIAEMPFALHGYAQFVSTSILDRHYRPDMSQDEAIDLMRKVVAQIQKRLVISMPAFKVIAIDKDGIKNLPDIRIDVNTTLGL